MPLHFKRECCLLVLNSVTSTPQWIRQPEAAWVCVVFVCKYVLGHSRVSQPLNLRLCLLRHVGFLTSPHASPTCRRRRLNSYRLLRRSTPGPTLFEGAKGERFRQVQLSPGVRRTKGKLLRLFVYEDDLATGGYQSVQSMNVLNSGL